MSNQQRRVIRGEVLSGSEQRPQRQTWLNEHRVPVVVAIVAALATVFSALITGLFGLITVLSQQSTASPAATTGSSTSIPGETEASSASHSDPARPARETQGLYQKIMDSQTVRISSSASCGVEKGWVDLEEKEVTYGDGRPAAADLMWETCDAFGLATGEILVMSEKTARLPAGKADLETCTDALSSRPEGDRLQVGRDVRAGSAFCFTTDGNSVAIVIVKKASLTENLTLTYDLWWETVS
ncbi:hypothetical protein ABZ917_01730 [Nonomuraea wenchangensis]